MIGKLLCRMGWHSWRHDGPASFPKYCNRCGWGPISPLVPMLDEFDKAVFLITSRSPEKTNAFRFLRHEPLSEVVQWLDKNFPLQTAAGWGSRSPYDLYDDLRAQMDGEL